MASNCTRTSIGLDFGTAEARAQLMDMEGNLLAASAFSYPHGVMTRQLPDGTPLPDAAALQHPLDYMEAVDALIPALFRDGADPADVIGIGVDFTQCTMMPVDAAGTPLCLDPRFAAEPYAYAKLWRHHACQPQADRLTEVARQRQEPFLAWCGGMVYAESMFPKILETYDTAPAVYEAADTFQELADWLPRYLTGTSRRSRSIAGCAALWDPEKGYPSAAYLEAVRPGFSSALEKLRGELVPVGSPVGFLSAEMARRLGLPAGIPVAAGLGDCQAAFLGAGLSRPGTMLSVMGTSSCDMLVSATREPVPGMYGISADSMVPGLYGYEAGQATMGDLFRWFAENWVPAGYQAAADAAGQSIFDALNERTAHRAPGAGGLLALDWWSGNRSVLLDTDLSGMILGMTADTRCEDVYQALVEALSFGKRRIVEQLRQYGIPLETLRVTGGVAEKNPYLMQTFADVMGMSVEVSAAGNGSCTGSCIYGALAAGGSAGGYDDPARAAGQMGGGVRRVYVPDPERHDAFETLYGLYKELHDYFGRENPVMKRLRSFRKEGGRP